MDTKEKKLNFLNSLEHDAVSSAEIVRFLLPYILSGTDPYTLLTRVNINRGLHPICESDVENFYKTLYDTWFSSLSRLNKDNTEPAVLEIIEIFKSQELTPENTTPKQAKEFFENPTNRYLMQAIFPIYISRSRKILDGDKTNHLFVYVKPSALHRKFTKCECRLYLNLKPKNAITMGAILGELCEEKNIPLCYKFWTADMTTLPKLSMKSKKLKRQILNFSPEAHKQTLSLHALTTLFILVKNQRNILFLSQEQEQTQSVTL